MTRSATGAPHVILAGPWEERGRWTQSLLATGARVSTAPGPAPAQLTDAISAEHADAVLFSDASPDLTAAIRTAVLGGCDVMVGVPAALTSQQFASLAEVARRRSRIVRFHDGADTDESLRFLRRMTRGPHALWRPRYLRSVRAGVAESLDELALAEVRIAVEILGAPERVLAAGVPNDEDDGAPLAGVLTLIYDSGKMATIHVSTVEPERRRESLLVCDGRSVLIDLYNARSPLQVQAAGKHSGPQANAGWGEVVSEFPVAQSGGESMAAALAFVQAVRARDAAATNCVEFAAAMIIWEAARLSMAEDGQPQDLTPRHEEHARPALHVIEGGGRPGRSVAPPQLTVVRPRPIRSEPAGTPA